MASTQIDKKKKPEDIVNRIASSFLAIWQMGKTKEQKQSDIQERIQNLMHSEDEVGRDMIHKHIEYLMDIFDIVKYNKLPDMKTYHKFVVSYNFLQTLCCDAFSIPSHNKQESITEDFSFPTLESLHCTEEEKQKMRNYLFESIKFGDVLYLRIASIDWIETKFLMEVLSKHGEGKSLRDFSFSAELPFDNEYVQNISPPLRVSEFVRAKVFRTYHKTFRITVSLRPLPRDNVHHGITMGRVSVQEVPFCAVDTAKIRCMGKSLEDNSNESAVEDKANITSLGKFLEENRNESPFDNLIQDFAALTTEDRVLFNDIKVTLQVQEKCEQEKFREALEIINVLLGYFPENDKALTLRAKIYLSMSVAIKNKETRKTHKRKTKLIQKAYLDLLAALKFNYNNLEAFETYHEIIKEAIKWNPKFQEELKKHLELTTNFKLLSKKVKEYSEKRK